MVQEIKPLDPGKLQKEVDTIGKPDNGQSPVVDSGKIPRPVVTEREKLGTPTGGFY